MKLDFFGFELILKIVGLFVSEWLPTNKNMRIIFPPDGFYDK